MKRIFNNAIICDKANETKYANIVVEDGVIKEIYEDCEPAFIIDSSIDVVDVAGLLIIPAGIDPHVHLSLPDYVPAEHQWADNFESGSKAALAGGSSVKNEA